MYILEQKFSGGRSNLCPRDVVASTLAQIAWEVGSNLTGG